MIEGQTSGIVFGRHPSQADLVVIEAVYGLNQGLVDGTIEPDRWSLEQATGRVVEHGIPESRQRCVARDGDLVTEPVPADKAALPPLDSRAIETVYRAVLGAEAIFRAPQDMEWTFRAADLVLLQSRPVTTSSTGEGDKRSWYLSLTRSLETIEGLRARVEQELLPTMVKDAEASAGRDLADLDPEALAAEIERRRQLHDHWVEVYSREFIPLAHGVRIFGQFYNDTLKPDDPYAFMELLVATPLLSVRRNRALEALAARLRSDTRLRKNLQAGEAADSDFEGELLDFERQFGSLSYESERCFADRARLVRLLISMAEAPARQARSAGPDLEQLTESFQDAVDPGRRPLARKLLDLARAAYRIRDDDNLYLSRLEAQVLEAVEEGRGRLEPRPDSEGSDLDPEGIVRALRHPNRVVEPRSEIEEIDTEPGFRVVPRQLVGQPAGPGVATGPARIVDGAGDLFDFQAGEVLVCDAVDPNMTFVVPMASAVIERRGGMLIHGAIIAREYGLACVTGVPNATSLISNGDRLTVDGFLGIVTVSKG